MIGAWQRPPTENLQADTAVFAKLHKSELTYSKNAVILLLECRIDRLHSFDTALRGLPMEKRVIRIETLRNQETGLLIAISPDMKGLYVHANAEEELFERVPIAIRSLLEAAGFEVHSLTEVEDDVAGFDKPGLKTFDACLAA